MRRLLAILLVATLVVVSGVVGFQFGRSAHTPVTSTEEDAGAAGKPATQPLYTCSMHPQIRMDGPGDCPLCQMPLTPMAEEKVAEAESPRNSGGATTHTCSMHPQIRMDGPGDCPLCQMPLTPVAEEEVEATDVTREGGGATSYTCSMHPQVRMDAPGNCPICQMPLIPTKEESTAGRGNTTRLSKRAMAMAGVETIAVETRPLTRELRVVGRVEYDESSLATITARVDGYIERLFVNFTGMEIRKGDHLAEVYSPELLVAQQELLIALQGRDSGPLVEVARTRLRLLDLASEQIDALVREQRTTDRVTLVAPIGGTVIEKNVVQNSAFATGEALFRIANLDTVWTYVEIYESDLPWVRYGQKVRIEAQAVPGRTFEGRVTFVQPIVSEMTRTIRVPVHVANPDHALKPGMFVTARIEAMLTSEGHAAPTGVEGSFTCPMHPQVRSDSAGSCPICQMPLERIPGDAAEASGEAGVLAVPVTAILDSGTRKIAYVELSPGLFEPRELTVGPRAGEYFPVLAGLSPGERVATRGNFLIDSQSQVMGRPSLFYPEGLHASMGHQHGAGGSAPSSGSPAVPPLPSEPASFAPAAAQAHKH